MSNYSVYPHASRLREDLGRMIIVDFEEHRYFQWDFAALANRASLYMKEYEHGTANPEDLQSSLCGMENVLREFLASVRE